MRKTMVGTVTLATLFLLGAPATAAPVQAPATVHTDVAPADPLAQQLAQASADQAILQTAEQSLSTDITAANVEQTQLAQLVVANEAAIQETLQKIAAAEQQFADAIARQQADTAAAETAKAHEDQDRRVLAIYIREQYTSSQSALAYILAGSSMGDALSREASLAHTSEAARDLALLLKADVEAAQKAAAQAQADANAAAAATAQLSAERDQLTQQTQNARQLIVQLRGQAYAATQELQAMNTQNAALAEQIANLRIQQLDDTIAKAETADWQAAEFYIQNNLGNFPGFTTSSTQLNLPPGTTPLVWPAPGTTLSQGFGPSSYPFEPPYAGYAHFHTGLDLAGSMGKPIYSAADGIVVSAQQTNVGYGNFVIIAHANGMLTLYGHLEAFVVKTGDHVTQGQLIGLMGSSGNSTGPHLHFEVRVANAPVNPLQFLPAIPAGASGPPAA